MTSSQIAEQVQVNRSTVIRTAQALGFAGFSDLQTALQQHFPRQYGGKVDIGSDELLTEIGAAADGETLLRRMVAIESEKLKTLPDIIRAEDFDRAVHLLTTAPRIGIIGMYLDVYKRQDLLYGAPLRSSKFDYSGQLTSELIAAEYERVMELSSDPLSTLGLTRTRKPAVDS